jgi:hypothetical protein
MASVLKSDISAYFNFQQALSLGTFLSHRVLD